MKKDEKYVAVENVEKRLKMAVLAKICFGYS